jgi:hypothetical protein
MVWDGGDWRLPAPLNAMDPPGAKVDVASAGSNRVRVLALLVWPRDRAQVVPAELVKWTHDRVLVEWWSTPGARSSRRTWLPRSDVKDSLRWVRRRPSV